MPPEQKRAPQGLAWAREIDLALFMREFTQAVKLIIGRTS
jgi:hypothetical protein